MASFSKKLRKGQKIIFTHGIETIVKASNDPINGRIETDKFVYSTHFILRLLNFGFIKIQ